ncbi:hypothetical protein IV203_000971 [Nitzschia inconspicua]|uniref:Uncharacterized protein n=1 Tax=Nitzschia inconspicua TaxID=303405 RepID=A0A9K3L600_9STRA|nr:hypothetical protein IV203_000971 [Nitzschia inconspicua]
MRHSIRTAVFTATVMALPKGYYGENVEAASNRLEPQSNKNDPARHLQKRFFGDREEMLVVQNMPKEIDVDPRSTYNQKFMPRMNSPCRPEPDGFFGATSGEPTRIQYGFELEIEPLSNVITLLDVIEDKVADAVIMNSFPSVCGLRRRTEERPSTGHLAEHPDMQTSRNLAHEEGHPSGFRFTAFKEIGTCKPQENDINFCGIFVGVVDVFGSHQHDGEAPQLVKSYIDTVLQPSDPKTIHEEVAAIRLSDQLTLINASSGNFVYPVNQDSDYQGLSSVAILMIVVSCMLVVAIVYYLYIQWNERKFGDTMFSNKKTSSSAFRRSYEDGYDPEERSIRRSPSLEAEDLFDGESFEDEYDGVSRSSQSTRSSRLQYSSRASSRRLDMGSLGLNSVSEEDEESKIKRNGELL